MFYALYCPLGIDTVSDHDMPIGFETEEGRDAFVTADPGDGVGFPFVLEKTDLCYIMRRWGSAQAIARYEDARRVLPAPLCL